MLWQKIFPLRAWALSSPLMSKAERKKLVRLLTALEIFSDLANVADAKSFGCPSSYDNSRSDVARCSAGSRHYTNQIRLSIGLENVDDLIEDLK